MLRCALTLWMTWCVVLLWSPAAFSQPYPSRPITLVVPYAAGSGVDILARILMAKLGQRLGQPIIVEAKPGAGSAIGTDFVAKSVPNGHTLMLTTNVLPVLPISGPAKLPPEITAKLNSEIAGTLNDVREPLLALGLVAEHSTPDALTTLVNVDVARWKELIASARITVE